MTKRMIVPLLFGLLGAAILMSLGMWQLDRLAWKENILSQIDARIGDAPVDLPETPDPETDKYMPVAVTGTFEPRGLRVLASRKIIGAGHRIITVFDVDGRQIMVDRGFLKNGDAPGAFPDGPVTVVGNLHWPDEISNFTPEPDIDGGLWFARQVPEMAATLNTEPVLIVARSITPADPAISPWPVGSSGIPNDHRSYAITWFSLAAIWLGMTGLLLWRIRRQQV